MIAAIAPLIKTWYALGRVSRVLFICRFAGVIVVNAVTSAKSFFPDFSIFPSCAVDYRGASKYSSECSVDQQFESQGTGTPSNGFSG
jgi:hypothetical protein